MSVNQSNGSSRKAQFKSQKLDRTLQELESAFLDWENLSAAKSTEPTDGSSSSISDTQITTANSTGVHDLNGNDSDAAFAKKTKKLLTQLREQLAELNA